MKIGILGTGDVGQALGTGFIGLGGPVPDLDRAELGKGLQALLGVLLDLIVGLVGEDLTMRLVSEVWPDQSEPDSAGYSAEAERPVGQGGMPAS